MAAEQVLDPGQGPAGRRHGKLLPGDLEQQGTVQVHGWQLGQPPPGIEVRPVIDEPGQHRVGLAQVGTCLLQPRGAGGIFLDHRDPPGYAVVTGPSGRYSSFSKRSVRTISMTCWTVSWRAQSRCSSTARATQPIGCAPACMTRSRPARWASGEVPPIASTTG